MLSGCAAGRLSDWQACSVHWMHAGLTRGAAFSYGRHVAAFVLHEGSTCLGCCCNAQLSSATCSSLLWPRAVLLPCVSSALPRGVERVGLPPQAEDEIVSGEGGGVRRNFSFTAPAKSAGRRLQRRSSLSNVLLGGAASGDDSAVLLPTAAPTTSLGIAKGEVSHARPQDRRAPTRALWVVT
jgi:hypothetical protein